MTDIPCPKFWEQVHKHLGTFCWIWIGRTDERGYGLFKNRRAHRVSWELHKGPIPTGKIVRHTCNNPSCVNPDHLLLGTHYDNAVDRQISIRNMNKLPRHGHGVLQTNGARNWESAGSARMRGVDVEAESRLTSCWKCNKAFIKELDGTFSACLDQPASCQYCPQ